MHQNAFAVAGIDNASGNAHLDHRIDAVVQHDHRWQILTADFHMGTINDAVHFVIDFFL